MTAYPYKPLRLPSETRVLILEPAQQWEAAVICKLCHVPLDFGSVAETPEPYDALSYCWSKSVSRGLELDPDSQIQVAAYGRDENGKLVNHAASMVFRDTLGHPHYEHLYIRLGGPLPDSWIYVDDVELVIGGELFRALRRLRLKDRPLRLWVDALCINQNDIAERNEHVKMMGDIYKNAATVRIWLGEEVGIEEGAFRTLKRISDAFEELLIGRGMLKNNNTNHEIQWAFLNLESQDQSEEDGGARFLKLEWDSLAEFFDRAWFSRTWIIQEAANARKALFHCGQLEFPWEVLSLTILVLHRYRLGQLISDRHNQKSLMIMDQLRRERTEDGLETTRMSLLELLEETRNFKATLGSDKIYGVLGLTAEKDRVVVDYSKSSEDVFIDLAVQHLQAGSLDILTHCVQSSRKTNLKRLPSWVPDWTRGGWTEPLRIRGLKCKATGDSKAKLIIDRGNGFLHITGKFLDKIEVIDAKMVIRGKAEEDKGFVPEIPIEHVGKEDQNRMMDPAYRFKLRREKQLEQNRVHYNDILDMAFPNGTNQATAEMKEAFWRTLMFNRTRENEMPDAGCAAGLDLFARGVLLEGEPATLLQNQTDHQVSHHGLKPEEADAYYKRDQTSYETFTGAHYKWSYNRRFYRSAAGRFGWTADGAQNGDVVAVFYGCDYPFMLRPMQEGRHIIIGDCYLHGFMEGEALADESEEEEIVLE